jgi:hypothetical protein
MRIGSIERTGAVPGRQLSGEASAIFHTEPPEKSARKRGRQIVDIPITGG